ncbi:hypothetical protein V22_24500 [Calycomorphotria hydatis]|uniref:Uncharacterized protein n=1 Tax=Calycomorphotria hydatis TaxID=2528027 RepID=A0A517TA14_9PLAN|nr:hypothetical protein V22_24500 [Calycomorphotria hydatis]
MAISSYHTNTDRKPRCGKLRTQTGRTTQKSTVSPQQGTLSVIPTGFTIRFIGRHNDLISNKAEGVTLPGMKAIKENGGRSSVARAAHVPEQFGTR